MRKKHGCSVYTVLLFIFISIGATLFFFFYSPSTSIVSPIPQDHILSKIVPFFSEKKDPEELKKIITSTIGDTLPAYSIIVKDFQNDFIMTINPDTVFTAASVNKLPILGSLYYLVQKGDITLTKQITIQPEDIQDYGTGSIRYDPPGTLYDLQTLAKLMIEQSDNTAAFILARSVIGVGKIQTLINSWGMAQTDMENNITTNTDMLLLMEKLYREKVANKTLTAEMLSFLKNGTIQDRIPALLPKEATIYHKTGNGVGFLHDVGIVVSPKRTYYIGIFTAKISDEETTIKMLATLSRIIYDFMEK